MDVDKTAACVRDIMKGASPLSDAELKALISDFNAKTRAEMKAAGAVQPSAAAKAVAEREATRIRREAAKQKVNAANNAIKQIAMLDQAALYPSGSSHVEAMEIGSNHEIPGSRDSAYAKQKRYANDYAGGLMEDLENEGVLGLVQIKGLDRLNPFKWGRSPLELPIRLEMAELSKREGGKPGITKNPDALKIAKIYVKWRERARIDFNNEGGDIGYEEGFTVTQSHDQARVGRTPFPMWRKKVEKTYGTDRTYEGLKFTGDKAHDDKVKTDFWQGIYNDIKYGRRGKYTAEQTGYRGPGDLAKRMSRERVLHAFTQELVHEYEEEFGAHTLQDGLIIGMQRLGKKTGLMEKMGTNPRAMHDALVAIARERDEKAGRPVDERLADKGITGRFFDAIDGTIDIPAHVSTARWMAGGRVLINLARLGKAGISSLTDINNSAKRISDTHGDNYLAAILKGVVVRLQRFGDKGMQRQMARYLRVGFDGQLHDMARFVDAEDMAMRSLQSASRFYFKLNFQAAVTNGGEQAHAMMLNARNADRRGKSFSELEASFQKELGYHGIGENEWDIIRKWAHAKFKGVSMLVADVMRSMPLEHIDTLVEWPLEALRIRAQEANEFFSKRAGEVAFNIQRLTATISQQGELGEMVGALKGVVDWVKEMQKRDMTRLTEGFVQPFEKAATAITRFTRKDVAAMQQHERVIGALKAKLKKAKNVEPKTLQTIVDTHARLKETVTSFEKAVEKLLTGDVGDITVAAKLKERIEGLQKKLAEATDSLGKQGDYARDVEDLKGLSEYVKTIQDTDYRTLVEKHRARVVKNVAQTTARLARDDALELAKFRRTIEEKIKRLKLNKRAEPAVLTKLDETLAQLDVLKKAIEDGPAKLERQLNQRREVAAQELRTKWGQFLIDQVHGGILRTSPREKVYGTRGLQPGTPEGEFARLAFHMKQYPMAMIQQILGRIAKEDRFWHIGRGLAREIGKDPLGVGVQTATYALSLLGTGYIIIALKDLADGKTPPDPTRGDTWARMFMASGGAGVLGDMMFAQVEPTHKGTVLDLFGPDIGTIGDIVDMTYQTRDATAAQVGWGDVKYPRAKDYVDLLTNNFPGANLFWARPAVNYMLLYQLQEALAPGSVARAEQRLINDRGQEHFYNPSDFTQ